MYLGKTLFAQAMDFLPWKTFHRIVNRYGGDHRTRSLSCAEQFRVMAFAQLTYRESLRDIEVCLAAQAGKLYHMGISAAVARSTLADANESRDWRIYFELAQRLITKARALYVDEDFGVELANTVYALDATTICDPETGKNLVFLTNQFALPALTICALYRCRWQVELFFKWIKQHLRIKRFYGTSENAVRTQIWIAISVYVLVAIIKKKLRLNVSLHTLLQILSLTLFEKLPLKQAVAGVEPIETNPAFYRQLNLFEF